MSDCFDVITIANKASVSQNQGATVHTLKGALCLPFKVGKCGFTILELCFRQIRNTAVRMRINIIKYFNESSGQRPPLVLVA